MSTDSSNVLDLYCDNKFYVQAYFKECLKFNIRKRAESRKGLASSIRIGSVVSLVGNYESG